MLESAQYGVVSFTPSGFNLKYYLVELLKYLQIHHQHLVLVKEHPHR